MRIVPSCTATNIILQRTIDGYIGSEVSGEGRRKAPEPCPSSVFFILGGDTALP
jgi:hypothetical protein